VKGKKKYLIGGIIILLALGSLSFMAFRGAATYYYTVAEITGQGSAMQGQNVRVAGQVAPGSLQPQSADRTLKFILLDTENASLQLPVVYQGAVPDAFKEGNSAVVEGRLSAAGTFEATQIIVKCPSRYVPRE
jgi:cytochrome c-type biogenesis protein CcmE